MKISNNTQQYINQSYTNPAAKAGTANAANQKAEAEASPATDSIDLSSTTRELQKISEASNIEQPDRAARIEELKLQVQTNQYTVNAEQVAEKMITGIFMNGTV